MSLTTFIQRPDVREQLDRVLPTYKRTHDVPLLVPVRATNRWLVGTAFDYAFRFELQRRSPAAKHGLWVAEVAIARLPRSMRTQAIAIVAEARRYVRRYAQLRSPTERQQRMLSRHALRLARLDVVFRAGLLDEALDPPEPVEAAEIANLLAVLPPNIGRDKRVTLNPNFAEFSRLVGGADADVFIGSTLLDVKTWAKALIEKQTARQLVGYLILARAARRAKHDVPDFKRLAVYFSRHAYLWELPVGSIVSHRAFPEVQRWFLSTAAARSRTVEGHPR